MDLLAGNKDTISGAPRITAAALTVINLYRKSRRLEKYVNISQVD
jgi:hypothetical protein